MANKNHVRQSSTECQPAVLQVSTNADRLAYRVDDACRSLGIGRTTIYALANEGKLRLIKIAGRTLVEAASMRNLVAAAPPHGGQ